MEELLKLKRILPFLIPIAVIMFIIMLVFIISGTSSNNPSIVAGSIFNKPFDADVEYTITSHFGYRDDPINIGNIEYHTGVDLGAPMGTPVLAIGDGIVYDIKYSHTGYGNHVYIKHEVNGTTYYSLYAHMLDNSIMVMINQPIKAGQRIGAVGSTGASTGYHLHLSLMTPLPYANEDNLIDPIFIIEGQNNGGNNE